MGSSGGEDVDSDPNGLEYHNALNDETTLIRWQPY